ncbi:uncharacterized protein RBU33_008544 isoform 1-T1 [Hipposideros larvatus]
MGSETEAQGADRGIQSSNQNSDSFYSVKTVSVSTFACRKRTRKARQRAGCLLLPSGCQDSRECAYLIDKWTSVAGIRKQAGIQKGTDSILGSWQSSAPRDISPFTASTPSTCAHSSLPRCGGRRLPSEELSRELLGFICIWTSFQ